VEALEQVLQLYREKYFDFNVQHFHEKLQEEHGIQQSYTWVKTVLQERGWWSDAKGEARIGNAGRGGRCCISMRANTVSLPTSGSTN
jgi:hypothetical protein